MRASPFIVVAGLLAASTGSCASPGASRTPGSTRPTYSYAIVPPGDGVWELAVEATLDDAPSARLVAPEGAKAIRDAVLVENGSVAGPLTPDGDGWLVPACRRRCAIRYVVDLDGLAAACHRMDCERRVGDAVIGQASTFMLRPDPMGDATFRVRAGGRHLERFVTGLRPDGRGGYVFAAREIGEASFTAFGAFRRQAIEVPPGASRARLTIALFGPPLAMGDSAAVAFVGESAACVAGLFGRFPVDATVFLVPVPGAREVVFGRVMSLAGASVALLFGEATQAAAVHDNWVVVHELFHLGTPSFVGEGHWLEEGLATYYEPIARERAGWMSEADLWSHFVREMHRGLREAGDPPDLESRDDTDSTYWGGALFAFLADVRIRVATAGVHSLDDVLRAALEREGDATHETRVLDFLRVGEEATGARALRDVYDSWAVRGENPNLDSLWQDLGIRGAESARDKDMRVELRDDAPLAAVRKAIAASNVHAPATLVDSARH